MTVRSWIFSGILAVYALYNLLWLIGYTFSFGKNDTYWELLFPAVTFIVDIPILWYTAKELKRGLILFGLAVASSIALGLPFHVLSSVVVPAMWYGPKVVMLSIAIWTYRSNLQSGSALSGQQE